MKHRGLLTVAMVSFAIVLTGCSGAAEGATPSIQGAAPSAGSAGETQPSTDGDKEGEGSLEPTSPSSSPTNTPDPMSDTNSIIDPESDNLYGDASIDEPVLLGQDNVPEEVLSAEEMQVIKDEILREMAEEDSGTNSRITNEHVQNVNDTFNGVMSLIEKRQYTEACEKYVYIPDGETVNSCAGKLQIAYSTSPNFTPMTKENTNVIAWDKENMTAVLKGKGRDESQQTNYFLVDGVWKADLI